MMSTKRLDYDIAIVGGGMIGSALTAALTARPECEGLNIALIDAATEQPEQERKRDQFDPRVVALSQASRQLLQSAGVWADIASARACPYLKMHVWDGDGTGSIDFNCADLQRDCLGHIVENSVIQHALRARLGQSNGFAKVDVCTGLQVEGVSLPQTDVFGNAASATELHLNNGESVKAQLVLAVDGAQSSLRQLVGLSTREWEYGHTAIVTTLKTQRSHQFTAWQRFTQQGPIAFLPLNNSLDLDNTNTHYFGLSENAPLDGSQNFCSLVWSVEHEKAERIMALSSQEFCAALSREFEYKLGAVEWADKRVAIPLKQRHAKTYFVPGVALVGDAAHTIHPLAGLGANLGLADAAVLVDEIARACKREVALTDTSILRRYQRQRQGENLAVMAGMEGFKRLFAADDLAVRWARNTGMTWLNNAGWLKNKIVSLVVG